MVSNVTVSWSAQAITDVTNYVYPSIDMLIAVFIVIGNAFVITAFVRFERLRTDVNLIIVNLSCADLLVAVSVLICRLTLFFNHHSNDEVLLQNCLLKIALALISISASIFFLLLMTTERYLKILHPFHYERWVTHGRIVGLVGCVWVFTIGFGFLVTYPFHRFQPEFVCLPTYVLPTVVQMYVLPPIVLFFLVGMLIMYGRIIFVARSQRRKISDLRKQVLGSKPPDHHKKTDYRLTIMLAYVTGFLSTTYIPVAVVLIYGAQLDQVIYWAEAVPEDLLVFAIFERLVFTCVFLNSLVNPIIYHLKNPEFRRAFRQMCGVRKGNFSDDFSHSGQDSTTMTDTRNVSTTRASSVMEIPK